MLRADPPEDARSVNHQVIDDPHVITAMCCLGIALFVILVLLSFMIAENDRAKNHKRK